MTPSSLLRVALVAAGLAFLAGCAAPPHPVYPDLRFTAEPPIKLDVATVEVRNDYQAPTRAPNVEERFPVPPAQAAANWAHDRLKAVGRAGRAVFVIRNAAVTETELPKTQGVTGALTTEPAQRYDLSLQVTVQIIDEHGLAARTASVTTTRSQSVLEGITPNDRDKAWYDMTSAAMTDFDRQMETEIRNNFGLFYVP